MAVINAGDLRFMIVLKIPVSYQNEEGGMYVEYDGGTTTLAAIKKVSNNRNAEAGSTTQLTTKEFYIRWSVFRSTITKDWIIVYNGQEWIIESIDPVEEGRNRFIKITAKTKERV